jgi:hypothetical protein
MMWHHWLQMVKYVEYELSREAPVFPQLLFACRPWRTADQEHLGSLCLTYSLVVELLEILHLQLVRLCAHTHICTQIWQTMADHAAPWSSTVYVVRKNGTLTAFSCTQKLSGMTKYDQGTLILCCTLEECELLCLCTCCNELLLFVHRSGWISEEIPVWNGEWCPQIHTQQWVSQEAHTCTCL